jgi:hypothetical protein
MSNPSTHRARRSFRRLIAVMLTTVYMLIVMSPLAPLAMHSPVVAHAVTGECSGDCDICGCSLESRASKTCCCAKKRHQQLSIAEMAAMPCSSTQPASSPAPQKKSCCAKSAQQSDNDHDHYQNPGREESKTVTVFKCGCPCGKGKLLALNGFGSNELLPITTLERIEIPHVETLYADLSHRLASRHGEPPDPPPRLPLIS